MAMTYANAAAFPFNGPGGFMNFGNAFGLATGTAIALATVLGIILYLYTAFVYYSLAVELGVDHAWMAWVPILNLFYIPQIAGHGWGWGFLAILPPAYFIALFVWNWQIYEMRAYPGFLALIPILGLIPVIAGLAWLAHFIVMGIVAWHDTTTWDATTSTSRRAGNTGMAGRSRRAAAHRRMR